MQTERSDERFAFKTKCWLHIDGEKYNCLIDNLSTTGASIEMDDPIQDRIQVGGVGFLTVLLLTTVEYPCKIVRMKELQVGLQFLDN
jgi:hypothetical protein